MEEERNKQTEIYEFLKDYTENKGYPPSVREICEAVNLSSTSTVHGHLKRLEGKGLIKRDPTKPRALEIAELSPPKKEMIDIPIIGKITKGKPILYHDNIEDTFPIPLDYIRHDKELYMLRVKDKGMIKLGINSNDLAILENTKEVTDGEIIAAAINDHIKIRRFYKEESCIRLEPENNAIETILIDECTILGKLVGIFRSF
ncbi:transcriptional repressor LexA [Clostridium sp. C2-6-12]|uniref:transcriptional repressor LexA n=1 Tax=Clostridium sp. C2-6-12 TaxID=2698832 RepID=UPI00136A6403|nr:transcriptional repressor LexA [Clostridium sp. C2-6-12]